MPVKNDIEITDNLSSEVLQLVVTGLFLLPLSHVCTSQHEPHVSSEKETIVLLMVWLVY